MIETNEVEWMNESNKLCEVQHSHESARILYYRIVLFLIWFIGELNSCVHA